MSDGSQAKPAALPPDNERALDPVTDSTEIVAEAAPLSPADEAGADEPVTAPPPRSSREERMKAIAEKVKAGRDGPDFTGDYADPSQTAGDLGVKREAAPVADEPVAEPVAAPAAAPPAPSEKRRFKLKVDGTEFDRDLDEVAQLADMTVEEVQRDPGRATRYAQKELAASRRLDKANEILRGAHQRPDDAPRRTPGAPHQEPRANDDLVPEPSTTDQNQDGDEFETLVQEIQIGDSKDAAKKLRSVVTQAVREGSRQATIEEKMQDDFQTTMTVFGKLKTANKELFDDPNAEAVMKRMLFDGYREDLVSIGIPEDRIPKDTDKLTDVHRFYRVKGHSVRPAEKLLTDVKDKYVAWRSGTTGQPPDPNPQPAPRQSQPRVAVDRTERRQAIPSQPARAAAPPQPPGAQPAPRTRSSTIMAMKKARGQVTA